MLRSLADEREQWTGYPMPLEGQPLVVEKTYPKAAELMQIGRKPATVDDDEAERCTLRNRFIIESKRIEVFIWNEPDGRIRWGKLPTNHSIDLMLSTLGASEAWGIEQEHNAVQTLGRLIRHHPFKQYLLTGMFLETSVRSGVTYIFRRLRPTIAIRPMPDGKNMRILAALCMHPIGYYENSWAGAMCPTDDVIAHLMLMRGDEVMFWRRCNQHGPMAPQAGL